MTHRWITYNGEIFNYIELREELDRAGRSFYPYDTEVIVHLYEEYGDRFVEIERPVCVCIWDLPSAACCWCAIAPESCRCITRKPARLVFASEVKAMLASGSCSGARPEGLDELMTFWAPLAPRTVFKGVNQSGRGEMLIVDDAGAARTVLGMGFPAHGRHRHGPRSISSRSYTRFWPTPRGYACVRTCPSAPIYRAASIPPRWSRCSTDACRRPYGRSPSASTMSGLDESVHQRTVVNYLEPLTITCSARTPISPASSRDHPSQRNARAAHGARADADAVGTRAPAMA